MNAITYNQGYNFIDANQLDQVDCENDNTLDTTSQGEILKVENNEQFNSSKPMLSSTAEGNFVSDVLDLLNCELDGNEFVFKKEDC